MVHKHPVGYNDPLERGLAFWGFWGEIALVYSMTKESQYAGNRKSWHRGRGGWGEVSQSSRGLLYLKSSLYQKVCEKSLRVITILCWQEIIYQEEGLRTQWKCCRLLASAQRPSQSRVAGPGPRTNSMPQRGVDEDLQMKYEQGSPKGPRLPNRMDTEPSINMKFLHWMTLSFAFSDRPPSLSRGPQTPGTSCARHLESLLPQV